MAKENKFTQRLSVKTTDQLKLIIANEDYVEEAKMAAKWILRERGEKVGYSRKTQSITKSHPWVLGKNMNPGRKSDYEIRLISFGIFCLISAFALNFQAMTTFKSSLEKLEGTIFDSRVFIENVSNRGRFGHEDKSRQATLSFSLNEYDKQFRLIENIGEEYTSKEYLRISKLLKKSNSVAVWINRAQMERGQPKVFRIDINGQTILTFDDVKKENAGIFIFMLILGLISICFGLYSRYPNKIRSILRMD